MSTLGPGVRVRCIRPVGAESWVVDGRTGVIMGKVGIPCARKGTDGIPMGKGWEGYVWTGVSSAWDVAIGGWGTGPMPEERLEPLDGDVSATVGEGIECLA